MDKLLGVFLPALVAVIIRATKAEDHNVKVLISLSVCIIVGCGVWYLLGKPFVGQVENLATYIFALFGVSQLSYQAKKGLVK